MTNIARVSTLQTSHTMMNYILNAESKYNNLTEEAASGIRVNQPSDDPVATKKILKMIADINKLNGYSNNISNAQSELETTSSALDSLTNLVQKASDYATQAANGTYNADDLITIKSSVDQIIQSVVDLANTNYNGIYLFSGAATSTEPYSVAYDIDGNITDITYNGTQTNDYQRYVTISDGVSVAINLKGSDVFGSYSSSGGTVTANGLFGNLMTLSKALADNDTSVINSCINSLNTDLGTVTTSNTKLAAVANRMDLTNANIQQNITNLKGYKSELQDADLTKVLTDLANQENALKATYSVTSQMLSKTSLLQYL